MPRLMRIVLPVSFFVLPWSHFSNWILLPVLRSPGKYGLKSRISETSHLFPYRSQIPGYDFTAGWLQPRYRCRATGSGRCLSHPLSQRITCLLSERRINVSAVIQAGAAYWSTSASLSLVIMEMGVWPFPEVSEHKGDTLIAFGGYRGCPTAGLEDFLWVKTTNTAVPLLPEHVWNPLRHTNSMVTVVSHSFPLITGVWL